VDRTANAAGCQVIKQQVKAILKLNEISPDASFSFLGGFVIHRALQFVLEQMIKKLVENTQTTSLRDRSHRSEPSFVSMAYRQFVRFDVRWTLCHETCSSVRLPSTVLNEKAKEQVALNTTWLKHLDLAKEVYM
jgi:hypothetical protein